MGILKTGLVLLFLLAPSFSQAEENRPFRAVQDMFAAMSAQDFEEMTSYLTDDFHLLEVGEVWDDDDLVAAFNGIDPNMKRRNYFSVIEMVENGPSVWISYWNRADFTLNGESAGGRRWLESAILVQENGVWKIQMLHSTLLGENQKFPDDVELVEYVK